MRRLRNIFKPKKRTVQDVFVNGMLQERDEDYVIDKKNTVVFNNSLNKGEIVMMKVEEIYKV